MSADVLMRRIEARAARFAAAAAFVALLARGWRPDWAAGIVAGWLLVAASAWLIRTGVERSAATTPATYGAGATASAPKRSYLRLGLRVTVRYALLAVAAYVMIGRLRLSPVGLLIGASSIVVSASIEAIRTLVSSRQI